MIFVTSVTSLFSASKHGTLKNKFKVACSNSAEANKQYKIGVTAIAKADTAKLWGANIAWMSIAEAFNATAASEKWGLKISTLDGLISVLTNPKYVYLKESEFTTTAKLSCISLDEKAYDWCESRNPMQGEWSLAVKNPDGSKSGEEFLSIWCFNGIIMNKKTTPAPKGSTTYQRDTIVIEKTIVKEVVASAGTETNGPINITINNSDDGNSSSNSSAGGCGNCGNGNQNVGFIPTGGTYNTCSQPVSYGYQTYGYSSYNNYSYYPQTTTPVVTGNNRQVVVPQQQRQILDVNNGGSGNGNTYVIPTGNGNSNGILDVNNAGSGNGRTYVIPTGTGNSGSGGTVLDVTNSRQ